MDTLIALNCFSGFIKKKITCTAANKIFLVSICGNFDVKFFLIIICFNNLTTVCFCDFTFARKKRKSCGPNLVNNLEMIKFQPFS